MGRGWYMLQVVIQKPHVPTHGFGLQPEWTSLLRIWLQGQMIRQSGRLENDNRIGNLWPHLRWFISCTAISSRYTSHILLSCHGSMWCTTIPIGKPWKTSTKCLGIYQALPVLTFSHPNRNAQHTMRLNSEAVQIFCLWFSGAPKIATVSWDPRPGCFEGITLFLQNGLSFGHVMMASFNEFNLQFFSIRLGIILSFFSINPKLNIINTRFFIINPLLLCLRHVFHPFVFCETNDPFG